MSKSSLSSLGTGSVRHRYFNALRGIDLSLDAAEASRAHLSYAENVWRDPLSPDSTVISSFPGFRILTHLDGEILGLFRHRTRTGDYAVVHAGNRLYRIEKNTRDQPHLLAALNPYNVTLPKEKGCAFPFGEELILLIGGRLLKIDAYGDLHDLTDDPSAIYCPTVFYNGKPYEQENLLTDRAKLSFSTDGNYTSDAEAEALLFSVYNEEEKSCSVRISERYRDEGRLTIPSSTVIGKDVYTVKVIAPRGFAYMHRLMEISIPETVTVIGEGAFYGDTSLRTVSLPTGVTSIGHRAFYGCFGMKTLFLGSAALRQVGTDAFSYCTSLSELHFGGTEEELFAINMEGEDTLLDRELSITPNASPIEPIGASYRFPLHARCLSIEQISLSGQVLSEENLLENGVFIRTQGVKDGALYTELLLQTTSAAVLKGKTLTVTVTLMPTHFTSTSGIISGKAGVLGCRTAESFDGRLFLTGNPSLPNTVFYTAIDESGTVNPTYVGTLCYFNDGMCAVPNRRLLSTGSELLVLKADSGAETSIFYHAPSSTDTDILPRIYPRTAASPGINALGLATLFADEPILLTRDGVFAAARNENGTSFRLSPRSTAVNPSLCKENFTNIDMTVFEGLLYLLIDGKIYLVDKRWRTVRAGGSSEYEWYLLTGIGSYDGDRPLYRYTSFLPEGALSYVTGPHPDIGKAAEGEIYSVTLPTGEALYYEKTESGCYPVDTDGERTGGRFSPATCLLAMDDVLLFGTASGAVGCFNTDKRGKSLFRTLPSDLYAFRNGSYVPLIYATDKLCSEDTVNKSALYRLLDGKYVKETTALVYSDGNEVSLVEPIGELTRPGEIHRYFYSYASHAYTAGFSTVKDDGDIPHFAKDTVSGSVVLKLKSVPGTSLSVFVETDRRPLTLVERVSTTEADAGNTDFSAFDFHSATVASFPLREKERGWCYKQYLFSSEGFRTPFGFFSLCYSHRLCGRIKP